MAQEKIIIIKNFREKSWWTLHYLSCTGIKESFEPKIFNEII